METIHVHSRAEVELIEVTSQIEDILRRSGVRRGVAVIYVPHTTAGVTVNENADATVIHDIVEDLKRLVPRRQPYYRHREGNSASHFMASLFGPSVSIPFENGRLALGTWQGIFFCEFDGPRTRRIHVQIQADQGMDDLRLED